MAHDQNSSSDSWQQNLKDEEPTTTSIQEEATQDMKIITNTLQQLDENIEKLYQKRQELCKAKEKIAKILKTKPSSFIDDTTMMTTSSNHEEELEDGINEKMYSYRAGRRFFTDAYKNYTVKLSQKYGFKAVAISTGVLYNNIVRWKMEKLRGQISPDDSYEPTELELIEEKRLETEYRSCSSYYLNPSSSVGIQSGAQSYKNSSRQPTTQTSSKDSKYTNPHSSAKWYTEFETKLVSALQNRRDNIGKHEIMECSKRLRTELGISEADLKFTKDWYYDLLQRNNIIPVE